MVAYCGVTVVVYCGVSVVVYCSVTVMVYCGVTGGVMWWYTVCRAVQVLRAKNRQLKSLVAEVNMLEVESRDGEHTEQRLQMELLEYKKKYYLEKKRRLHVQEVKAMRVRPPVLIEGKDQFTGGGFKITQR